ncbi:MAG: DUF4340 domain-containing protein [Clostridia bacterium]|nr:DUF4340 domain-containing protein [Clostridia bacterium]
MKRNEIIYTDAETFTPEEEKNEGITAESSTFASAGAENGKAKKTAGKQTKVVVICLLVAAALLIGGYFIFLHEPATDMEEDPFYLLTAEGKDALEDISGTISFKDEEDALFADSTASVVYKFALSVGEVGKIKVKTGSGSEFCTVSANGNQVSFKKEEFFRFLKDGTAYAFDGENMFVNSFLSLCGEEKIELSLRAMNGYDTDGDVVTSTGKPFMYPSITRSDVASITVQNKNTTFKVYRESKSSSTFYIEGAEGVQLNAEAFSYLVVNATYTCAEGKLTNPKDFSQYGLEGDGSTAKITIKTNKGDTHVLIIGDKDSSGAYNYARYEGKPHVYMLLNSDVESTFAAGGETFLTANLVYSISDTNEIYSIDKMSMYFRDLDQALTIRLRRAMSASSNLVLSNQEADVATLLSDLKRAPAPYSDWTKQAAFIGIGSKDGNAVQIAISLNRVAENGKYSIKIPLVKDEGKGAYLPENIKVWIYTDGENFNEVKTTGMETLKTQKDGTYVIHTLSFESEKPVQYVRIDFEGYSSQKLLVTDEIRVMAGDLDANPADAFIGLWMVTTDDFIPENRNYAYVNTTAYVEYLLSVCTLVGDEVVEFGIEEMDLAKYGLGKTEDGEGTDPAITIHYVYGAYTMDILLSDPLEDGSRYAASMITTLDSEGEEVKFVNPYIAKVYLETAPWMDWEPLDFVSSSLLYMYIDDVNEIKFTYGGESYNFVIGKDEAGIAQSATCNGKEIDMNAFRQFYIKVINVSREGEYKQGDETGSEMLRINLVSETKSDEIIFYRVTSSKAYYTIDGAGGYYTLTYEVSQLLDKLEEIIGK